MTCFENGSFLFQDQSEKHNGQEYDERWKHAKRRKDKRGGMARKRAVPSVSFSRRAHLLTTSEMRSNLEVVVSRPGGTHPIGPCALRGGFRSLRRTTDDAGCAPLVRAAVGAVLDSASRNCPGCCGALRRPTPAVCKTCQRQVLQIYGLTHFIPSHRETLKEWRFP